MDNIDIPVPDSEINVSAPKRHEHPDVTPANIKAARIQAGMTQVEAAARFNYSLRTWQAKEDGGKNGRGITLGEYELLMLLAGSHPTLSLQTQKNRR